ncbi:MAG: DUF1570 domain-containing protein [Pirellulales bacterium]
MLPHPHLPFHTVRRNAAGPRWVNAFALWATLACSAASVAIADDTPWVESCRIDSFRLRADFAVGAHDTLLDELGGLRRDVSQTLGIETTQQPVDLYLFGDRTAYESFLQRRYPKVPFRRALFIKNSVSRVVCAYRSEMFDVDLRHEATHALLHSALPRVPLWIDEGLAEYFEMAPAERASGHPHFESLASDEARPVASLASLERKVKLVEMGRDDYRDAWAWVHFMLHGPREAHEELVGYLAELADGKEPEPLSLRLARRFPDVEHQLVQHLAHYQHLQLARAISAPATTGAAGHR